MEHLVGTLELGGRTQAAIGEVGGTVFVFVGEVVTILPSIALVLLTDALPVATLELSRATRHVPCHNRPSF